MTKTVASAIARIDAMDTEGVAGNVASHGDAWQAKRDVGRVAEHPGAIAWLDKPRPDEPDIAAVLVVSGGGMLIRVALGRNRTANLISHLVVSLT